MSSKFNKNVRNVLATSFLLATLTVGTGQAFANEEQTKNEEVEVVEEIVTTEVPETEGTIEEGTTTDALVTENPTIKETEGQPGAETTASENEEESTVEEPTSIIDFFKNIINNIQTALENNDAIEAIVLAKDAQEKIEMAEALLTEGKEEEASKLLDEALASQELALQKYEEAMKEIEEGSSSEGSPEEVVQGDVTTTEDVSSESGVTEEDSEEVTAESIRAKLEAKFSSNLLALQTALEKVGNPKAKAALAKNVEKAKIRLEKKVNKELAKIEDKGFINLEETNEEVPTEKIAKNEVETNDVKSDHQVTSKSANKVPVKSVDITEKTQKEVTEEAKNQQDEVAKKVEKQQEVVDKKAEKQQEKVEKETEKQQEKLKKETEKQQANTEKATGNPEKVKEKGNNGNGNNKGNDNGKEKEKE